jgi:hypothetical protein
MVKIGTLGVPAAPSWRDGCRDQPAADALVAAIRKPLEALEGAADEAAKGMLGRTKLGLLVATNGLIAALEAVDAEFARRAPPLRRGPGVAR